MDQPPVDVVDRYPRAVVIEVETDVCIACGRGSQTPAKLYARYSSGVTAAFCVHHGTEMLPKLLADGAVIIDHRYPDET